MRFVLTFLFLSFFSSWVVAQEKNQPVPSTITAVTVFRQGAAVTREATVALPAGRTTLSFSGLSAQLDQASIQVEATGNFTILSVTHQVNYLQPAEELQAVEQLKARLADLQEQQKREQASLEVYTEEEGLILANKSIGGQQTGVELEKLEAMAEFYRSRLTQIKLQKLEITGRINGLQEEIRRIEAQLRQAASSTQRNPSSEILVSIDAPRATSSAFQIAYLVRNARWAPQYDLRVTDIGKAATLDWKADVAQQSGESWNNVRLTLSTGNPSESGSRPQLEPWRLYLYQPPPVLQEVVVTKQADVARIAPPPPPPPPAYDEAPQTRADLPVVLQQESATTVEFRIETPYTIPTDGKPFVVNIQKSELPLEYEYIAVPKLDKDAFLTGRLPNWEPYHLLSGPVNIFLEGAYVGKSALDVQTGNDTLTFSLGRDKGIVVTRTQPVEYSDRQSLGNKKTERSGWQIDVRNTKSTPVRITLEDQYPLSTTDVIEVTLEEASGATVDPATGALRWTFDLAPGASRRLDFRYAVKYPKKERVIGQ